MLINYKMSYNKIAMGLLSYMPKGKDIKILQQTMELYENESDWKLFLSTFGDDIIGVVGIHMLVNGDAELIHLCVNPSFRDEGIGRNMVNEVMKKIPGFLLPTEDTKEFFLTACEEPKEKLTEETQDV